MSGNAWRPRTIRRFVESYPTSTNVIRVDTDQGEGFLKALGNPEGPHVLACELVGTMLAEWLGLSTLDYATIDVDPMDELPFANGGFAEPGPGFITRAEEGFPWGGDAETLRQTRHEDVSLLVVLDTWIRNCDRHRPAPNPRINRDNVFLIPSKGTEPLILRAMDHSHSFTCGAELTRRIGSIDMTRSRLSSAGSPSSMRFLRESTSPAPLASFPAWTRRWRGEPWIGFQPSGLWTQKCEKLGLG